MSSRCSIERVTSRVVFFSIKRRTSSDYGVDPTSRVRVKVEEASEGGVDRGGEGTWKSKNEKRRRKSVP